MDDLLDVQRAEIDTLRERVRQLENILAPDDVHVPVEWRLTASEAKVFAHLTTREIATKQSLMLAMYSDRVEAEPDIKIVDVFICKMRKKLSRFGVEIITVWGSGFSLANRSQFIRRTEE